MKDSSAQHESKQGIPEDPNESEISPPQPEPKESDTNPYLLSVSKDLKNAYEFVETRNLACADFNYDHRMLIPKKTYQATKKSLITNYRRSVLGCQGLKDRSLNINQANIEWKFKAFENHFIKRDQESQVFKAGLVVPVEDDTSMGAPKVMSETDIDFQSNKQLHNLSNLNKSKQHDFRVVIQQNIDGQRAENEEGVHTLK